MTEFTPIMSFAGGMLIGLAAVLMMLTNGRIAGISGILSSILPPKPSKAGLPEAIVFLLGLLLAAPIYQLVTGAPPAQVVSPNIVLLIAAGLLTGIGTILGSGCTSGHGVCGISRFSRRSILATITFMLTGIISVYILKHIVGA